MALSNLQGEQLPDSPEPVQIARDRSLKKTNSKYKTRGASDVKKVKLHDHINQFPGQHLSVEATQYCTAYREAVSSMKSILLSHCVSKKRQWERKHQEVEVERTNHY